jgi:serine/threonine-protein kinase
LVCDFGLARRIEDGCTPLPELVGTLSYMAPEQMEGRQALTVEADVWSLGAVLYEFLTGSPPFVEGRRLDRERKRSDPEPLYPHSVNPAMDDADLSELCRRCLQHDPPARYRSATELADRLLNS